MSKKKRRKFTKEFREEAVKLVTEQGYKVSEAARNLDIHEQQLGNWKRAFLADSETLDHESISSMKDELKSLRKENKRLEMERDILKKAAAFFAKEMS